MKSSSVIIQMKATERHFPVVLRILMYKVVLTFDLSSCFMISFLDHSVSTSSLANEQ